MRIEQQRERRAERERRIDAVGAGGLALGVTSSSFSGGTAAKILPQPPSWIGMMMTAAKAVM